MGLSAIGPEGTRSPCAYRLGSVCDRQTNRAKCRSGSQSSSDGGSRNPVSAPLAPRMRIGWHSRQSGRTRTACRLIDICSASPSSDRRWTISISRPGRRAVALVASISGCCVGLSRSDNAHLLQFLQWAIGNCMSLVGSNDGIRPANSAGPGRPHATVAMLSAPPAPKAGRDRPVITFLTKTGVRNHQCCGGSSLRSLP
jgi:hypothetical protein